MRRLGIGCSAEKNPAVQRMLNTISALKDKTIVFSFEMDEDGHWVVESKNLPGLITGGDASDSIDDAIIDAVFTYFDVPAEFCDKQVFSREYAEKQHSKRAKKVALYSFGGVRKVAA